MTKRKLRHISRKQKWFILCTDYHLYILKVFISYCLACFLVGKLNRCLLLLWRSLCAADQTTQIMCSILFLRYIHSRTRWTWVVEILINEIIKIIIFWQQNLCMIVQHVFNNVTKANNPPPTPKPLLASSDPFTEYAWNTLINEFT